MIKNIKVMKMLIDGGVELNLLSAKKLDEL
jgi:hypothetical protein